MQGVVSVLKKIFLGQLFLEKLLLVLILSSMIFLCFLQVVLRNVFSTGLMWVDELSRIEVLWLAFLGAGLSTEYNRHLKIDVLAHAMGTGIKAKIVNSIAQLFATGAAVLLCIAAASYVKMETQYATPSFIRCINTWVFELILPYTFFMMAVRFLVNLGRIIKGTFGQPLTP